MNTQAVLILGRSEGSLRLRLGTVGYYTLAAMSYPGYFLSGSSPSRRRKYSLPAGDRKSRQSQPANDVSAAASSPQKPLGWLISQSGSVHQAFPFDLEKQVCRERLASADELSLRVVTPRIRQKSSRSGATLSSENKECGAIQWSTFCSAQAGVAPTGKSLWRFDPYAGEK